MNLNNQSELSQFLQLYSAVFGDQRRVTATLMQIAASHPAIFAEAASGRPPVSTEKLGSVFERVVFSGFHVAHDQFGRRITIGVETLRGILQTSYDGRKVEAIKQLRAATGLGLKEAKDLVELWEQGFRR